MLADDHLMMYFQYLCAFAWADHEIQPQERDMILRNMETLSVNDEQRAQILGWLETPPDASLIDPYNVPRDFRKIIFQAAKVMVISDGELHPLEEDMLDMLKDIFDEMKQAEDELKNKPE